MELSPHQLLAQFKSEGVILKMRGNQLVGPKTMNAEQRLLISRNKDGLIVALTYQCRVCDSPVRVFDREPRNYFVLECVADPVHYSEVLAKREGVLRLNVPLEEAIEPPVDLQAELGW